LQRFASPRHARSRLGRRIGNQRIDIGISALAADSFHGVDQRIELGESR